MIENSKLKSDEELKAIVSSKLFAQYEMVRRGKGQIYMLFANDVKNVAKTLQCNELATFAEDGVQYAAILVYYDVLQRLYGNMQQLRLEELDALAFSIEGILDD